MTEREYIAKEWRDKNGLVHRREIGQELVRCRECIYGDTLQEFSSGGCGNPRGLNGYITKRDYCSYGERRQP